MQIQPYLSFEGRCEEAIEFYRQALGAEVEVMLRYKDVPGAGAQKKPAPGTENMVLHASLRIGGSSILASDGMGTGAAKFQGISLALTAKSIAEAEELFAKLSAGGAVLQPLQPTFFTTRFGLVADRFGVSWMITVAS
jgi:PhnB protein